MKPTSCCHRLLIAITSVAIACSVGSAQVLPKNKAVPNPVPPVAGAVPAVTVTPPLAPAVTVTPQPVPAVTVTPQPVVTTQPVVTAPVATVIAGPVAQNIQATRAA